MNKEIFKSLLSSIRENGQLEPITINNNGEVLDGHHRLRACEKLRLKLIVKVKTFNDISEETLTYKEETL
jgi:ParB-like chromosome segregation protein Spo0J